jgi:non-heme chloroperoxidase
LLLADATGLVEALDPVDVTFVGHSIGGGEVARYIGRHGETRASKLALLAAVTPFLRTAATHPGGAPIEVRCYARRCADGSFALEQGRTVPKLILHGSDDRIALVEMSGNLTAKIVKNAKFVVYDCAQHGFLATHKDRVNADLLAFLKS